MNIDPRDLRAFVAVASARGFRDAARLSGASPSGLSDAVRRLETELGVRLLHRTTRSVAVTEAGDQLIARLGPAFAEIDSALDAVASLRDRPAGVLRLNVPVNVAQWVLPTIVTDFLAAYPGIRLEVMAESSIVDVFANGCDAGVRYDERLEKDMIAVPIGPRRQRFAAGASGNYLAGRGLPEHPEDLLQHDCIRIQFRGGTLLPWEFNRGQHVVVVDPDGPLVTQAGTAADLGIAAAIAGAGVVFTFEDNLRPHFISGALEPVLEPWWPDFTGPFLYYSGSRLVPAPLRAFIDFVKALKA